VASGPVDAAPAEGGTRRTAAIDVLFVTVPDSIVAGMGKRPTSAGGVRWGRTGCIGASGATSAGIQQVLNGGIDGRTATQKRKTPFEGSDAQAKRTAFHHA
jgi:hypothetical protein